MATADPEPKVADTAEVATEKQFLTHDGPRSDTKYPMTVLYCGGQ